MLVAGRLWKLLSDQVTRFSGALTSAAGSARQTDAAECSAGEIMLLVQTPVGGVRASWMLPFETPDLWENV